MPCSFYTSGHSLADIIRERLQGARTLSRVQDELARQIASGEIVITPLLPQGWRLRQMEDRPRRVVIETDSERYELYEYRCHFPTDGTSAALSSGDGRDGRAAEDRLRFATGAAAAGHDGNAKDPPSMVC